MVYCIVHYVKKTETEAIRMDNVIDTEMAKETRVSK